MNFSHFVRTDWLYRTIIGFASLCKHNSPIRYASWAKHSYEAEIMGDWLWAMGYGLLVIGNWRLVICYWWLAIGYGRQSRISVPLHFTLIPRASTPDTLRFTLLAPAPLPLTSNLSPYRLIYLPFGSVLTQMPQADAGAVRSSAGQNRWLVRRTL